jgi:anti-anti-sigma factor
VTAAFSAGFRIVIGRALGTVVVTVHGDLDPPAAEQLGTVLADLIDGQGNMAVVVDLHDARAADARCLSVFTGAAERATRRRGSLTLSEPPEILYEALILAGLGALVRTTRNDAQRRRLSAQPATSRRPRAWAFHPARGIPHRDSPGKTRPT